MQHRLLTYLIALVWFINGLVCKILNLVPRHQQIVARILGDEYAPILTRLIGFAELVMVVWILSKFMPRFNAATQIIIVASMNVLEYLIAPDLLLWGKWNAFFAFCFCIVVYYNTFVLGNDEVN